MPSLSLPLGRSSGSQSSFTPAHFVPIGSAFDCAGNTHLSTSLIDLTTTGWAIGPSVSWYRSGNGNTGAPVDVSNGQFISMQASGSGAITCGVTSTTQSLTAAWAGVNPINIIRLSNTFNHIYMHFSFPSASFGWQLMISTLYDLVPSSLCIDSLCRQKCENGGICDSWNHCRCMPGFTGDTCTEYTGTCGT
jgi:hypothetical protein